MKGLRTSAGEVVVKLSFGVARSVENFAGTQTGVFAMVDHDLAVHDHEINSVRRDVGMLVSRAVLNFVVVEDCDVRPESFAYEAAVGDPHPRGRPGSHLANRVFERQRVRLAHIPGNHARKISIATRVREGLW